jgi:hypothetical protein
MSIINVFVEFFAGVVVFYLTTILLGSTILTGTDAGTTIMKAVGGLTVAALALFVLLKGFKNGVN